MPGVHHPRSYWSGIRLAPKLPVILAQLALLETPVEEFRRRKANLEQLPYSLGGQCYSFFEFLRIQGEIVRSLRLEPGVIHVFSSDEADRLGYMLDAFLDHARRVANAAVFYLGARYSISLPQSMADLAKRLEVDPLLLPGERELLLSYWREYGSKVKAYRDLAQHHALLASDCRAFVDGSGQPGIYLAIPNNPEVKSVSKLSFEDPIVHAFLFMRRVFYESVRFANRLASSLLDPTRSPNRASLGPNIIDPAT